MPQLFNCGFCFTDNVGSQHIFATQKLLRPSHHDFTRILLVKSRNDILLVFFAFLKWFFVFANFFVDTEPFCKKAQYDGIVIARLDFIKPKQSKKMRLNLWATPKSPPPPLRKWSLPHKAPLPCGGGLGVGILRSKKLNLK